ncbi:uncharacterized protein LY89DRAFT_358775 [Mollisia scopiformis]|uniref:Uncharacterized protein n=1 Tax=Mollisia scopiformis TaxID=149040 RepID=A0A132B5Q8_MOLSC|nr:uncharacterized protein LY89DRAFT_358775 [Mollisia scopiformis]KUJ07583.1 hypothetical protein LY89DRAFT_358775 [Mollisia scopiformis]
MFCVFSKIYLYTSGINGERTFPDDFLAVMSALLGVGLGQLMGHCTFFVQKRQFDSMADYDLTGPSGPILFILPYITEWPWSLVILYSGYSIFFPCLTFLPSKGFWPEGNTLLSDRERFLDYFFPSTEASLTDLDQATALLARMTMLGFSLYSAADAHYRPWWEEVRKRREEISRDEERHISDLIQRYQLVGRPGRSRVKMA